jgi:hypothetical protein
MPIFKGFEKNEADVTVAVVDFPNARKFTPQIINGRLHNIVTPNPHEERLDEQAFASKFGMGFDPLRKLAFRDEGYDLKTVLAAAAQPGLRMGAKPAPGQDNNM